MLVKDKLQTLFTDIQNVKKLAFFDFIGADECNNLYIGMFGGRTLGKMAEGKTSEELAKIIVGAYGESWNNTLLAYTSSIKELGNYTQTVTETITDKGTSTNNSKVTGKVSAFNNDDFVNDDEDTTETEGTNSNERKRIYELNKIRNTSEYLGAINYLKTNLIYDIIMVDINRLLTLNIFN